jgi:hypothetical protein
MLFNKLSEYCKVMSQNSLYDLHWEQHKKREIIQHTMF